MSLVARIGGAWADPSASFRAERGAGEPRLLAWAFGVAAWLALGAAAAETVRPTLPAELRDPWFAGLLLRIPFFVLALYGSAALLRLASRALGGTGGWRETRAALFWSGLVAGPAAAFAAALGAGAGAPEAGRLLGQLLWVGLLAPMLAEAQGFRALPVLLAFLGLALAAFAVVGLA